MSGKSLIRNLQIGLQRAAEFGEPMRVGYVPDCFGHIAQLPQILQGFGIDNAVFWRGVGSEAHKSEFYWAAPDGTTILVLHLADARGYSNAALMPLKTEEFVTRVELLTAPLLAMTTGNTLLFMNGSDHLEPQESLPWAIESANKLLAHIDPERKKILTRYGRNAHHGNPWQLDSIHLQIGTLPQYIQSVRQHIEQSAADAESPPLQTLSGEMRSSQLAHLLPSVLSTRMWIKQQNAATEHLLERWVEPLTAWAGQLGAPYPQGLVRLAWKYLLQNHPHDSICGCSIDQVHNENKVRFAQSQQIGEGVVASAMHSIVSAINTRAPFPVTHTTHEAVPIIVFNPAPGPRTEVVRTVVQLPGSLRNAVIVDERGERMPYTVVNRWRQELGTMPIGKNMLTAFVALEGPDAANDVMRMAQTMIPTMLGQAQDTYVITRVHVESNSKPGIASIEIMITPRGHITVNEKELNAAGSQILALLQREDIQILEITVVDEARETIEFVAADLPAYGLKTFWLYPRGLHEQEHAPLASSLTGQLGASKASTHSFIENEWYRVEANPEDGTLTVTDKQNGAVFTGLNRFIDGGDVGDLYNYCPPAQDILVSEPVDEPKIEVLSTGPVHASMRISGRWFLPAACTPNRDERSSRTTLCHIDTEVSLAPGVRRIDIHTRVENRARDHRLRVIFPIPYTVESAAAEGTFEVRSRPVALPRPPDVAEWAEEPVNTFPQKRFVDVSNGTLGLGVLNRGLPEYEVIQNGPGLAQGQMAVALTLLRCVEWLSRGDLATRRGHAGPMEYTPEAQCLGYHEFDYALVPHSGDWEADEALVLREAQAFNIPLRAVAAAQHAGQLASRTALIEVEPRELVVSAIKRGNNGQGLIVRVYNPLSHAVEARLKPGAGITSSKAFVTNLQEEPREQIFWSGQDDGPLSVGLRSREITTILFQ